MEGVAVLLCGSDFHFHVCLAILNAALDQKPIARDYVFVMRYCRWGTTGKVSLKTKEFGVACIALGEHARKHILYIHIAHTTLDFTAAWYAWNSGSSLIHDS